MRVSFLISALVIILVAAGPVLAQQRASAGIYGSVVDAQGAAVPGARVTLTQVATNQVRTAATDDQGEVQPTVAEIAEFWRVQPDFFQTTDTVVGHFNAIQPWKVNRDGSVQNAIAF